MVRTVVLLLALVGCTDGAKPTDDTAAAVFDGDGDGYLPNEDCDDADAAVHPGADELCNEVDDDCDALTDEQAVDRGSWYFDADGDGYGDPTRLAVTCTRPEGVSATAGDCDDGNAAIHPGAAEACDGADVDEDCDGAADDADPGAVGGTIWYVDGDEDGFGDDSRSFIACDPAGGRTALPGDCADGDAAVNPGAIERCDAADTDEDCDGLVDDADSSVDTAEASAWYLDSDDDGHGDPAHVASACDAPPGYTDAADDCDDTTAARSPAVAERCDTADVDEDCDGLADDADPGATGASTWYVDADQDGFGDPANTVSACDRAAGTTADLHDCDDTNIARYPQAPEQCDGVGNDCDTLATWTTASEAGVVSWIDSFGGWISETDGFALADHAWTAPGDGELVLCEGTYSATLDTAGFDVRVTGLSGASDTWIDAGGADVVVAVEEGTTWIEGLTLTGGYASEGGGIRCRNATLAVTDTTIQENAAEVGGGLVLDGCAGAVLDTVRMTDNQATSGGAFYGVDSPGAVVTNASVQTNTGEQGAAFYLVRSTVVLGGGEIAGNEATDAGGVGYLTDGSALTGSGVTVSDNAAGALGALHIDGSSADFVGSSFSRNEGADALFTFDGTGFLTLSSSIFTGNRPWDAYIDSTGYSFSSAYSYTCAVGSGCY